MEQSDRIAKYLRRLTPLARSNLLSELERLQLCGLEMPGAAAVLEALRAEFRKAGQPTNRTGNSTRYFFAPLEPFLIDGDPDHPNPGRISRGSLAPIWEWISRDQLPTMARDYAAQMKDLIVADKKREAEQAAATFQTKVLKSLENTLASTEAAEEVRVKLGTYTASHCVFGDLTKIACALRARDALAKFNKTLPDKIARFDDDRVAAMTKLLDEFGKTNHEALPFA